MSSVQHLRALINERLTAAAEEIFTEFEKTIVQYEEEIDRQRRLLEITWKPEINSHTTDFPQQHVHEENVLVEQNLCNQERNFSLDQKDQEHPHIKEEQKELCTSQEGKQLALMQEADMLVQCNFKCEKISKEIFQSDEEIDHQHRLLDIIWKPQIRLHRIDFQQQHVCKEDKGLPDQQLCNHERNFSLDQDDPEPSQIKAEQEELCPSLDQNDPEPPQINEELQELCISQQGEQIILKQATDTFLLTLADEDREHSELEPNSDQLLSDNLPVADSRHQEGGEYVELGSTRKAVLRPRRSHNRNSSHSNNVDKSSLSENHCVTDTGRKYVKCDVGRNTIQKKYQIQKPHQIHKDVKPYACNACGKSFNVSSHLKRHMIKHTGEKGICCKTCGKVFSRSNSLIVHMRIHTGEKPYSCETCGKSFRSNDNLLVHMRTHTGEKPYSCERCGKNFSRSDSLNVHMTTHTGEKPYFCETCGKSFRRNNDLTVHMRTHMWEKFQEKFSTDCSHENSQRSEAVVLKHYWEHS